MEPIDLLIELAKRGMYGTRMGGGFRPFTQSEVAGFHRLLDELEGGLAEIRTPEKIHRKSLQVRGQSCMLLLVDPETPDTTT